MALLNASGNPVATKTVAVQIDLECPTEEIASAGAPNWLAVVQAAWNFWLAWKTGDPTQIAQALQALLKALMGG